MKLDDISMKIIPVEKASLFLISTKSYLDELLKDFFVIIFFLSIPFVLTALFVSLFLFGLANIGHRHQHPQQLLQYKLIVDR